VDKIINETIKRGRGGEGGGGGDTAVRNASAKGKHSSL
jgi:hypothetical protein